MTRPSTDQIRKQVFLNAAPARVWKALTDHHEFGAWFRVKLEGPFIPGKATRGRITYPGYEHLVMEVVVQRIDPPRLFSFTWHPYAVNPAMDYRSENPTLVEFIIEPSAGGTLLTVTESGFDSLPPQRRDEAFRMNSGGWEQQLRNIQAHVTPAP